MFAGYYHSWGMREAFKARRGVARCMIQPSSPTTTHIQQELIFLRTLIKSLYPYPLYSRKAEAVAVVLHMQVPCSWAEAGQRAPVLAAWGRRAPVSSDEVLGSVVVVHVQQQTNDVQNVHMEEDHNHNKICPRTDAASLDM